MKAFTFVSRINRVSDDSAKDNANNRIRIQWTYKRDHVVLRIKKFALTGFAVRMYDVDTVQKNITIHTCIHVFFFFQVPTESCRNCI